MSRESDLTRRAFLALASFAIPVGQGIGLEELFISGGGSSAGPIYVCPPCGLDCDKLEFNAPGTCPVCGMKLVEKGAAAITASSTAGTVRFPDGKQFVEIPFELLANAVFVKLQVNGKGPFTFGLDTGSFNSVVASEIIDELGVSTGGSAQGLGSGTSFTLRRISQLDFLLPGGLQLGTTNGAAVAMAGLSNLIGRRFDGDLGHDVLQQMVVKIDYRKEMLTFYDADHFRYEGDGAAIPFTLWADYDPQIDGEISIAGQAPIPVKIVLDTGAGGTILTTPFVTSHDLTKNLRTLASPDVGQGGGESTKWEARAESLRIGPYLIHQPLVALSTDAIGSLAHASFDVNLGGNILRRFTVIIDYPRNRLILEPNANSGEPFASDASGLILKAEGAAYQTFVVRAVVPNSPAARTGLKAGDIITGVKGHPINQYALWQLQELFKQSGQTYELTVHRGPERFVRSIKLQSLL